jgi:hypothetical protein
VNHRDTADRRPQVLDALAIGATSALAAATVVVWSAPVTGFGDLAFIGFLWPFAAILWAASLLAGTRDRNLRLLAWIVIAGSIATVATLGYPFFFIGVFVGPAGFVALFVSGLVLAGVALRRARPWRRSWIVAPVIVVATLALLMSGIPRSIRFAYAETALSAYARQLLSGEVTPPRSVDENPVTVGSIPIHEVTVEGGELHFITGYIGILDDDGAGLAYVPSGAPAGPGVYQHLQGPWYAWSPY